MAKSDVIRRVKTWFADKIYTESIESKEYTGDGQQASENTDIKFNTVTSDGDMKVTISGDGLILTSPDGTVTKRIYIANDGTVSAEAV